MTRQNLNRRNWIRNVSLAGAGLIAAPQLVARPESNSKKTWYPEIKTWEKTLAFPPKPDKLKARLLANENPYGPSPMAKLAIMESVSMGNRYGHEDAARLKEILAEKEGVTPEHIILGPGSTDILEKTAIVQFAKGGNIVSADPAYMSLIKTAVAFQAEWRAVKCTDDWAHDLDGMYQAMDEDTKLVYVCNPNNPTGSITDADKLYAFCKKASEKAMVFVDEAYLEFLPPASAKSMVKLVQQGANVMIARTFSKIHGMAGLRLGYGIAQPEQLEKIRSMVRTTMGLNITTLRGGIASIKDTTFQTNSRNWNTKAREYTTEKLKSLGFDPIHSVTSFILFPLEAGTDGEVFLQQMFSQGLGVRFFEIHDTPYCRVSMGTMDEMSMFIDGLKKVLG
jgi:histidinol-phosphate aminotransferase